MATTTLSTILQKMGESIDDHLEFDTTTLITTNNSIISTELIGPDKGSDDYFISWGVYISEGNNDTKYRRVALSTASTGTLTIRGSALSAETVAVTCQLHKYDRTKKVNAINRAINELFPSTRLNVDNMDLITGNILPPFNWSTTALLDVYTEPTGTLLKNTSPTYIWNGSTSAKITGSGADDILYITSDAYPRLLKLMGDNVDFKCWVYPDTADDTFLTIYTLKPDGTAQTLNSTTTTYATKKNLISLESQALNDDLTKIEFRLRVHTTAKVVYFDMPRVTGHDVYDYLLPSDLQNGTLSEVYVQTSGEADDACDDIRPDTWQRVYDTKIIDDGTYRFLHFDSLYSSEKRIRLIGSKPLETLALATDTVTLSEPQLRVLVAKANELLFESLTAGVSSEDKSRFEIERIKWAAKVQELAHLNRGSQAITMNLPRL